MCSRWRPLKAIHHFRKLVAAKKTEEAQSFLPQVYRALDKTAKAGTIKKNTASRLKSRLAKLVESRLPELDEEPPAPPATPSEGAPAPLPANQTPAEAPAEPYEADRVRILAGEVAGERVIELRERGHALAHHPALERVGLRHDDAPVCAIEGRAIDDRRDALGEVRRHAATGRLRCRAAVQRRDGEEQDEGEPAGRAGGIG